MRNSSTRSLALLLGLLAAPALAGGPEPFTVVVDAPAARVGASAVARVKVQPAAGYHFNKDFPTSLKLVAPAGVELQHAQLKKTDPGVTVAESGASFEVPFTAKDAGKKSFSGTVSFAVCTATTCDPRRATVAFVVDVK
jgi:hypothetical protein